MVRVPLLALEARGLGAFERTRSGHVTAPKGTQGHAATRKDTLGAQSPSVKGVPACPPAQDTLGTADTLSAKDLAGL